MIYPIYTFGQPVLRKVAAPIDADYPNLPQVIENMHDTLAHADGIGLAAPQVGLSIRLIIVNLSLVADTKPNLKDFKRVLINPLIVDLSGNTQNEEEGCLSLPGIHELVPRFNHLELTYQDEQFVTHHEIFEGFIARVIQHEYDHIEGHLFIDRISPIRRQMIQGKLNSILKGHTKCDYKIKPAK
ncbi:MAG: peptide deformylase [Microbacter sp.]